MFVILGATIIATTLLGVVVDDEFYRLLNTVANFATVALLVWHQQHVKRQIEPKVKETAAVVQRELGSRDPGTGTPGGSPQRRKDD